MTSTKDTIVDMERLRTDDADARTVARTVFDTPVVLVAGAGTGKTTALVARVVSWLVDEGFERARAGLEPEASPERAAARALDGLLAITFTDAAAADMDAKIRAALALVESGQLPVGMEAHRFRASDDERRARSRALRRALERPIAQTIHSFCQRILAQHPLEAGLHPQFTVDATGRSVRDVARQCVTDDLAQRGPGDPHLDWFLLAARELGPAAVERALTKLVIEGHRAADLDRDSFPPAVIARIDSEFTSAVRNFLHACRAPLEVARGTAPRCGALVDALGEVLEHASSTATDAKTLGERARGVAHLRGLGRFKIMVEMAAGKFLKTMQEEQADALPELEAQCSALAPLLEAYARLDPELEGAARRILVRLLGAARAQLVAHGIETFGDLLRDARDLLRDDPDVCAGLRAGLTQVLVDEFQDTDPVQCDVVRALTLDPSRAGRPGLLIVGDPKQSIYGFRSADLAAYEAFVANVLNEGGTKHRLSLNFRSGQKILDHVARAMSGVMIETPGLQPAFEPLVAHRSGPPSVIEHWNSWEYEADRTPQTTPSGTASRIEARFLARELLQSHARGVEWHDMAVLLRSKTTIDVLLDALRDAGVPFDVAGDKSYYRRREVLDAAALVTCVVDPSDHVALLAYLRSPFVGVPDALLIPLWRESFALAAGDLDQGNPSSLTQARACVERALERMPRDIPGLDRIAGFELSLDHALEALSCLRASLARDPADVFVEKLRLVCLAEATAGARFQGAYRLANLERFFGEVTTELERNGGDLAGLLRYLREAVTSSPDTAEAKPRDADASAVQILTIHKSKGLDFREVFVLGLWRQSGRGNSRDLTTSIDGEAHILFDAPNPPWFAVEEHRHRRDAAESVRVLYVAMTRAKDRLVLSGSLAAKPPVRSADPARKAQSLLALFEPMVDESARRFFEEWTPNTHPDHACGDVLYRVAYGREERAQLPEAARDVPDLALQARQDSERLLVLRTASTMREKTPIAVAMSAIGDPADAWRDREEAGPKPRPSAASLAGTAVHAALEAVRLDADLGTEMQRERAGLGRRIESATASRSDVDAGTPAAARAHAETVLDAFVRGDAFQRFLRIAPHVVAREVPILARVENVDGAWVLASGAIDLVYRDPSTGEFVVVDYKTDAVADAAAVAERVAHHRPQIQAYRQALKDALSLPALPRAELWFLARSHVEPVS